MEVTVSRVGVGDCKGWEIARGGGGVRVNMIDIHGWNGEKLSVLHDTGYSIVPWMQESSSTQQCTSSTSLANQQNTGEAQYPTC